MDNNRGKMSDCGSGHIDIRGIGQRPVF